jgi:hypothetical protein
MIYAILNSQGKCINRTVWDGKSDWQPPDGCTAIPDPNGNHPLTSDQPASLPAELTTEQKLEAAGLTVAELKELFGLT